MRRILNLFLLLCLPLMTMGEEISQQQAREKACAFMQHLQGRRVQALGSVSENVQPVEMGLHSLYAFNCKGGGYVIVSGDNATTPILGYSPDGVLNVDEMPANLRTWLEGYADQIRRLQRGEAKAATRRAPVARAKIEPLVKAQWNQRAPFNLECPKDVEAGGVLSASGCVATAMSQVMYFHKWPQGATTPYTTIGKKDVPSTTFDWDNMLPVYEEGKYTEAQGNAVAHLMRWAGWSVDMQYAAAMSGAATGRIDLQDSGISQGQIQVKADDGRLNFCLLRVDPSLAGKTVRFTDGNINTSLFQKALSSSLYVYNNYCRHTKQNVYVVEGNRFVLKQSIELKPFTQYLQLADGVENPPAFLTIVDVNNPSGIDEVRSLKANDQEIYYDLQGRRLNGKPQRGLYIKNGKKIIVQ